MDVYAVRAICLSLPRATETVQWGDDLVFKIGGKMFAVAPLEPSGVCLSFKCTDEEYARLVERPGIIPAPYLARAKWGSGSPATPGSAAITRTGLRVGESEATRGGAAGDGRQARNG